MPNGNDNNNSAYEFPSQNPDNFNRWLPENMQEYKDSVYDRISKSAIHWINQIGNNGFGHATLMAETFVGNDSFIVQAGDTLILWSTLPSRKI